MAIDLTPILSQIISTDIVEAVMLVSLNICIVYVTIFAVMNWLGLLRGEGMWSWGLGSHLEWFDKRSRERDKRSLERDFKQRYSREVKTREYRNWKKSKGL